MEGEKKMLKKAFTLSYDDGVQQDRRLLDLLNKYNLKGTFNMNSGKHPQNSYWEYKDVSVTAMDMTKSKRIYAGHEIAVHGTDHIHPLNLSPEELKAEFSQDKKALEKVFGEKIHGMAYAFGEHDTVTRNYLKKLGIQYGRTVEDTMDFLPGEDMLQYHPTCHHNCEDLFLLGEKFLELNTEKPQIFYLWGHSYEFDADGSWERMEAFFKLIAGRDDIFYGTNYDVFNYYGLVK